MTKCFNNLIRKKSFKKLKQIKNQLNKKYDKEPKN